MPRFQVITIVPSRLDDSRVDVHVGQGKVRSPPAVTEQLFGQVEPLIATRQPEYTLRASNVVPGVEQVKATGCHTHVLLSHEIPEERRSKIYDAFLGEGFCAVRYADHTAFFRNAVNAKRKWPDLRAFLRKLGKQG